MHVICGPKDSSLLSSPRGVGASDSAKLQHKSGCDAQAPRKASDANRERATPWGSALPTVGGEFPSDCKCGEMPLRFSIGKPPPYRPSTRMAASSDLSNDVTSHVQSASTQREDAVKQADTNKAKGH